MLNLQNDRSKSCRRKSIVWKVRASGVMVMGSNVSLFFMYGSVMCCLLSVVVSATCGPVVMYVFLSCHIVVVECRRTGGRKGEMQGTYRGNGSHSSRYPVNVDVCPHVLKLYVCIINGNVT